VCSFLLKERRSRGLYKSIFHVHAGRNNEHARRTEYERIFRKIKKMHIPPQRTSHRLYCKSRRQKEKEKKSHLRRLYNNQDLNFVFLVVVILKSQKKKEKETRTQRNESRKRKKKTGDNERKNDKTKKGRTKNYLGSNFLSAVQYSISLTKKKT
jgi:hypothetical protein